MNLKIGAVVASYPFGPTVDVLLDTGMRLPNVQVMVLTGSDKTGEIDLPDVGGPIDDTRWNLTMPFELYVRAVIGFIGSVPVCVGFLLPQVTQLTFAEKNRRVMRHASDVYTTIDDAGNFELAHPSGTFVSIGLPAHNDLTGKDFDKSWAIKRNTGSAPHLHIGVANAGTPVASVDIDPSGNISIQNNGNTTLNVGGNVTATVGGTTSVTSSGAATLKAPSVKIDSPQTEITGSLTVDGALTFKSGMTGSAGSGGGATMNIQGSVNVTGGEVTVDGIGSKSHHHTAQGENAATTPAQA